MRVGRRSFRALSEGGPTWAVVGANRGSLHTASHSRTERKGGLRENGIFPGVRLTILYATAIPATTAKADHRTELEIAAEGEQRFDEPQA